MASRTVNALGQWTAIAVCGLAAAALAISQAFVIHDHVAMIHGHVPTPPPWPALAQWAMAAGFELAILAVTLAMAITGFQRHLVVAECFLVGVSILAGALVTYPGPVYPLIETASMALVPVQYVAVVLAAHALYGHYAGAGQPVVVVATTDQPTATTVPAAMATATSPRPRVARRGTPAGQATDPRVAVAIAAGVPRTTARRWAATGDARLNVYRMERAM